MLARCVSFQDTCHRLTLRHAPAGRWMKPQPRQILCLEAENEAQKPDFNWHETGKVKSEYAVSAHTLTLGKYFSGFDAIRSKPFSLHLQNLLKPAV